MAAARSSSDSCRFTDSADRAVDGAAYPLSAGAPGVAQIDPCQRALHVVIALAIICQCLSLARWAGGLADLHPALVGGGVWLVVVPAEYAETDDPGGTAGAWRSGI